MTKRIAAIILTILIIVSAIGVSAKSIIIAGQINQEMAERLISTILYYDTLPEEQTITVYINSPGGDTAAAYMIADVLKACKKPVETVVMGRSMSAAVIISTAGTRGLRYAYKHAQFLIHEPYYILPKETILHEKDANGLIAGSQECKKKFVEWLLQNTNIDQLSLERYINSEFYFDAKTARKLGVIDKIVNYENNPNRKYDGKNN